MSHIRKLKYEDFFEEPPAFQYLGGFMNQFKSALGRQSALQETRGEKFEQGYAAGRDEGLSRGLEIGALRDKKAVYQEGHARGRQFGQLEGAKLFALEGGEYVTAHQETGMFKGYKTIEDLVTDTAFRKETIDYLSRKHANEIKISLENNIPKGSVESFQQALDKIRTVSTNRSTTLNTTKNKYISDMLARNNDISTLQGKIQLFKDVTEYKNNASFGRDWSNSSKADAIVKGMGDYLQGIQQAAKLPAQVEAAKSIKQGELEKMSANKLRKRLDIKISDVPFILTDSVNEYNVKKLREGTIEGHIDWRTNKTDLGTNIEDYLFKPRAAPEPTFTSREDINDMIIAAKNAPIPKPFATTLRPRLTLEQELKKMPHPIVTFDPVEITAEGIFDLPQFDLPQFDLPQIEEIISTPATPIKTKPELSKVVPVMSPAERDALSNLRLAFNKKIEYEKSQLAQAEKANLDVNTVVIDDTDLMKSAIQRLEEVSRSDNLYEAVKRYYQIKGIPYDLKGPMKQYKKALKI